MLDDINKASLETEERNQTLNSFYYVLIIVEFIDNGYTTFGNIDSYKNIKVSNVERLLLYAE